mmetsp:Transcript_41388/g.123569  ORF Transcript_41388/g.123569 Transcript_41388/m.123569 type:complete len:265 (-) Transcript_41388:154-948(-)
MTFSMKPAASSCCAARAAWMFWLSRSISGWSISPASAMVRIMSFLSLADRSLAMRSFADAILLMAWSSDFTAPSRYVRSASSSTSVSFSSSDSLAKRSAPMLLSRCLKNSSESLGRLRATSKSMSSAAVLRKYSTSSSGVSAAPRDSRRKMVALRSSSSATFMAAENALLSLPICFSIRRRSMIPFCSGIALYIESASLLYVARGTTAARLICCKAPPRARVLQHPGWCWRCWWCCCGAAAARPAAPFTCIPKLISRRRLHGDG